MTCDCAAGFTGANCSVDLDFCTEDTCLNDGGNLEPRQLVIVLLVSPVQTAVLIKISVLRSLVLLIVGHAMRNLDP